VDYPVERLLDLPHLFDPANPEGAKVIQELVLHPIEAPSDESIWRATDGTEYDTAGLAARCIALLEEQIDAG